MPDHSTSPLQFWLNSPALKSAGFPENPQPSAQRLWRNSSCCSNLSLQPLAFPSAFNIHWTLPHPSTIIPIKVHRQKTMLNYDN
jgi:hypothetical protein